jgi:hypothetical protein
VDVYRTFADGESTRRSRSRRGTREVRTPTGKIHAVIDSTTTLCGISVLELYEFGRSRYPFEHFPHELRCPTCNDVAGRPVA